MTRSHPTHTHTHTRTKEKTVYTHTERERDRQNNEVNQRPVCVGLNRKCTVRHGRSEYRRSIQWPLGAGSGPLLSVQQSVAASPSVSRSPTVLRNRIHCHQNGSPNKTSVSVRSESEVFQLCHLAACRSTTGFVALVAERPRLWLVGLFFF